MRNILTVRHLSKDFGGIKAVDACSFSVPEGKIVGLIGPNGAGKTTVFNIITGFLTPTSGHVLLDGVAIGGSSPDSVARRGISRTFQSIRLFPNMTVIDNMMLGRKNEREGIADALFRIPSLAAEERQHETQCMSFLEFVGLTAKKDELAKNLSYGQQKLLEIARALVGEPEILLLDEPAAGVNLTMLAKISELLKKLRRQGKTILLIEHNMEFVMGLCDTVVVLDYGKEIAVGTPAQVRKNKKVLDAYLGGIDTKIVT
ncbi:MAG: ABC transporter ATP-binding protein [Candidatus Woesearchaeota archaeon]|nr:ABC transporter ATP-binding protein [Candidatus Woesearchaeota archaeon]